MHPDENQELVNAYESVIEIGFYDRDLSEIDSLFADSFIYYGTGEDEKGITKEDFRFQIQRMREQAVDYKVDTFKRPVSHIYLNDKTSALFVDEFRLDVHHQGSSIVINIRHSILMDKRSNGWICTHIHASVAYDFQTEGSSWPIEEIKKRNLELEQLVKLRTNELNLSLQNLKAAQDQLIHSEKMASLGELTSGIAHEIQNPLNFINNFSDINAELLEEACELLDQNDTGSVKEVLQDIRNNMNIIEEHGKRAESIVKIMQMHNPGKQIEKDLMDLNPVVEEYVKMAFHSEQTKHNNFNISLNIQLDDEIPRLKINPNEIGKAVVNLVNNGFDGIIEKSNNSDSFIPEIGVKTTYSNNNIIITVTDNGIGVNPEHRDKIFQPFFTTKPTGKGVGLGLSLSFDIISKSYGGEIKHFCSGIENENNELTEFRILIPVSGNI